MQKKKKNVKLVKNNESRYYDPENVGGYGGVKRFDGDKKWLRTQPTYSLHKPLRKKFPTRTYMTSGLNYLWQMDLMEMIPYAKINKGYRYILTCIDVFSRFARAQPVKTKSGADVANAIKAIFKSDKSMPRYVQTDQGKEFYNSQVQSLFKKHKIKHYSVKSQFKAALCERFNRSLREKLTRWFTHQGNKTWYRILPTFVATYNKSKNRGIFNKKPIDITKKNEHELWEMQQRQQQQKQVKSNKSAMIPLLNYVRISRIGITPFKRNFDQNWSEEVFRVIGVDTKSQPTMYILEDLKHDVIEGKFYKEEIQDIGPLPPQVYRIEKVIRTKGKGKYKQYYVKWYGYDKSQNSWINASNLQHYV